MNRRHDAGSGVKHHVQPQSHEHRAPAPATAMLPLALLALLSPASAGEILFTPDAPSPALPACLRAAYHGEFGGRHVYRPAAGCAAAAPAAFSAGSVAAVGADDAVVWVTRAGLAGDDAPLVGGDLFAPSSAEGAPRAEGAEGAQAVLAEPAAAAPVLRLLHEGRESLFASLPRAALGQLDALLPRRLAGVVLGGPVPVDGRWDGDVPGRAARHLANVTAHLTFRAEVDDVLDGLSAGAVAAHVRWLTGEAERSPIRSRHAMHPDARLAAAYIRAHMAAAGFECAGFPVRPNGEAGWAPSVVCALPGEHPAHGADQVVLSAHYDSRGSFGSAAAPGANDDASGTAHLLALAAVVGQQQRQHALAFERTLVVAFWSAEEQGLLGSHAAAAYLASQGANVTINVQADMLGYRVPGEPPQLALPASIHTPEASDLVSNVSALYAPALVVGRTPACCTDHQSFLTFGFPATALFERNGPIADPMYHNSGDVSNRTGYDFEQIKTIARVTLATALEVAGAKFGNKASE